MEGEKGYPTSLEEDKEKKSRPLEVSEVIDLLNQGIERDIESGKLEITSQDRDKIKTIRIPYVLRKPMSVGGSLPRREMKTVVDRDKGEIRILEIK